MSNVWINSIRLFLWVLFLFILEVLQVYWGQIKLLLNPGQRRYDKENPNDDDNDGNDSDYDCDNYGDWRCQQQHEDDDDDSDDNDDDVDDDDDDDDCISAGIRLLPALQRPTRLSATPNSIDAWNMMMMVKINHVGED